MQSLAIGNRVTILVGKVFKGQEATITEIGIFNGRKRYKATTNGGLHGWLQNKELKKII